MGSEVVLPELGERAVDVGGGVDGDALQDVDQVVAGIDAVQTAGDE